MHIALETKNDVRGPPDMVQRFPFQQYFAVARHKAWNPEVPVITHTDRLHEVKDVDSQEALADFVAELRYGVAIMQTTAVSEYSSFNKRSRGYYLCSHHPMGTNAFGNAKPSF